MKLSEYLANMDPDPVRYWVAKTKELGAEHMFSIGIPDAMPVEVNDIFSDAAHKANKENRIDYPPVEGEEWLRKSIITLENNFNTPLTEVDLKRMFVTDGASQALQFTFSIFGPGSEILVSAPCWGTILNIIHHSGLVATPIRFFVEGKFIEENAKGALNEKPKAIYINIPSNPMGVVFEESEIRKLVDWALTNDLQIITDEPYKYLIYDPDKTPYICPLGFSEEANQSTTLISSFSKTIKPDIRAGFTRIAPSIVEHKDAKNLKWFFRNLSAGVARPVQAGVKAVIDHDSKLNYLRPVVEGYARKAEIMIKYMTELGCQSVDKPNAGFVFLMRTPEGEDGEKFVERMATDHKIGFVPGSGFGGNSKKLDFLDKEFRIGIGGNWTVEKIEKVMESVVG